jgi:aconitate hydratase
MASTAYADGGAGSSSDSFSTADVMTVAGVRHRIHRLPGLAPDRLPYSLKIVLESLLRHEDGARVTPEQIAAVRDWSPTPGARTAVDVFPARAFLHDTNGVPALADLAAMRDAVSALGGDPRAVNPLIPAELTVDHSVIADVFGRPDAAERNVAYEYERNAERYRFLKWGQSSLGNLAVVPPGSGIMHQINLEKLARVVMARGGWAYPDLCLGTDSHTTMVNGLGVLGWGIGGIEAEAVLLGQSLSMVLPDVVGFRLHGEIAEGATATDVVLTITELLRGHGVVGKFVEFFGPGVGRLSVPDRATIANMAPESGSTCAYFPVDDAALRYLRLTGRGEDDIALVEAYTKEQGLWHDPGRTADYTEIIDFDLARVVPSIAGPRRPQDRLPLNEARASVRDAVRASGIAPASAPATITLDGTRHHVDHGIVAIAAITSCTNTSNPSVMVAAGLLARNAVRRGLRSKPWVKTTLSPGSLVVTDYLDAAGLTPHLKELGFHLTGYGCMTCIGASGPLIKEVAAEVARSGLQAAAVLSGNRNFDGRINPDVRMNYLASPPLVVAYALAGTMDIDLYTQPLGHDPDGAPVLLRDIWPAAAEIQQIVDSAISAPMFAQAYADLFTGDVRWQSLGAAPSETFPWEEDSTYLRRPPYFDAMESTPGPVGDLIGARALLVLGDSVTTDHLSPAGAIPEGSGAGRYLLGLGVARRDLNSYASRRGNHEVMTRGAFGNARLRSRLLPSVEGGYTRVFLDGADDTDVRTVYDAAALYRAAGVPQIVIAGKEYGTGSSRDWAAKGPALLGVRAVLAESFERIHRSNLVGMGILPLQFRAGESARTLGLTGTEEFDILGLAAAVDGAGRGEPVTVTVRAGDRTVTVDVRLDTAREALHLRHGGIMKYVLREFLRNG